jgi:hypothetical protein
MIIEIFFTKNEIKLKLRLVLKFGGVFGILGKPLASQI